MKHSIIFSCAAVAALGIATLAQAAVPAAAATPRVDLAVAQQARAQVQAQITGTKAAAMKTGVAGAKPGGTRAAELFANPDRAYPPSCLNSPMPLGMWNSDPNALVAQVRLIGDPYAGGNEANYSEIVKIYVFRVVCTSGLSATLLEIDRPSNMEGNTSLYPTFPGVSVTQGGNGLYIRLANDPNTFFSTTYALNPLINSDVFVLENFYGGATQLDYGKALALTVDNLRVGDPNRLTNFNLPNYNPSDYTAASQPLPISGYMTGAWYDPAHSGEGIQVEVGEQGTPGTTNDRYLVLAWYTYDPQGSPYWLYGAGSFTAGDRTVVVPMVYSTGGGFGGAFGSATTPDWGTISVQFPDCNTMKFSYQSYSGLPSSVPTGNNTKTWFRGSQMNGLTCM